MAKKSKRKPKLPAKREPRMIQCYLCGRIVEGGQKLAQHLVKSHTDITLADYERECPKKKPFDVSQDILLARDIYQAQIRKSITGQWPSWYDAEMPVALDNATQLAEVLLTGFVAHKIELAAPIRFAAIIYTQVLLDPAVVIRAARSKRTRARIMEAIELIDRLEGRYLSDVHAVFSELKERLEGMGAAPGGGPMPGSRTRFVAAEVLQSGPDDRDQRAIKKLDANRQKEIAAQFAEFTSGAQAMLFGGDHHLRKPPSEVEKSEDANATT